ncbi:Arm DNA-binding domain-containing protein, partial [Spirosoma terrae]
MTIVKVSYKAVYNRRKQLDRNGKASVLIEAYQNGKRRYLKTGIHLSPNEWDERTKEVKKRPELNRLIRNKIDELERFELTFSGTHNRPFRLIDFDLVNPTKEDNPKKPGSFTAFALEHIQRDHANKSIGRVTFGRYNRVMKLRWSR